MQHSHMLDQFKNDSESLVKGRRRTNAPKQGLTSSLFKVQKWMRQKNNYFLVRQHEILYDVSLGLASEYSHEVLSFVVNLALYRCLLSKKVSISAKQATTLKKFLIIKPEFDKKVRQMVDKQIERFVASLNRSAKRGRKPDKTKNISPEKALEMDKMVGNLICACLEHGQKSHSGQMIGLNVSDAESDQIREMGMWGDKVSCTDWVLMMVDVVGVILGHRHSLEGVAKNCLNFLVKILRVIAELKMICPQKVQIYQKIMGLLISAQISPSLEVRQMTAQIIKVLFKELLFNFHIPFKRQLLDLLQSFNDKMQKQQDTTESLKRAKKKAKKQVKLKKEYLRVVDHLQLVLTGLNQSMLDLSLQVIIPFKRNSSVSEKASTLEQLTLVLLHLSKAKEFEIYETVKEHIFGKRQYIESFVTDSAGRSEQFETIFRDFLRLGAFNYYDSNQHESRLKAIRLRGPRGSHIQVDLEGHCFLDNMVYSDHSTREYKGQIITQKNYLISFMMILHPDPSVSQTVLRSLIMHVNSVFLHKHSKSSILKAHSDNSNSISQSVFLQVLLILYQMALLKTGHFQDVFVLTEPKSLVSVEFESLVRLLQNFDWDRSIVTSAMDWFVQLSDQFVQKESKDTSIQSVNSADPQSVYGLEEVLCHAMLCFFDNCFDFKPKLGTLIYREPLNKSFNHLKFLLGIFRSYRDRLFELTFAKMKFYSKDIQSKNQVALASSQEQDQGRSHDQAIVFVKLLKRELEASEEGLENTRRFICELEHVRDERLLKEMIEWVFLFGKKHAFRLFDADECPLRGVFEKSRLVLQQSLRNNSANMNEAGFVSLLKVQFCAPFLPESEDLFTKLGFIHELLENYTIETWTYRSVSVIKACLNLVFLTLKSVFARVFDISLNGQKEALINTYLEYRPQALKCLQAFTLYRQHKNKLSFRKTMDIRKEAFELLVKVHLIVSNDRVADYKLVYCPSEPMHLRTIIGFLIECVGLGRPEYAGSAEPVELDETGSINCKNVFLGIKERGQLLNSFQKIIVKNYRQKIKDVLSKDAIGKSIITNGRSSAFYQLFGKLLTPNSLEKEPFHQHLEPEHYIEAKEFWKSQSGNDLRYYLMLLVCDLMDQASQTFGMTMAPHLIRHVTRDNISEDGLSGIVYSFLRKVLRHDMFVRVRARFWKYYLETVRAEQQNVIGILNVTRLFLKVYQSRVREIRRNQAKNISEKLQISSDKKQQEIFQAKIIFSNFLNLITYLINQIEPEAKDFRGMVTLLLVEYLLKVAHFENSQTYTKVLMLFHGSISEIEGVNPQIKKQKRMAEDFVTKELNRPQIGSSLEDLNKISEESPNTDTMTIDGTSRPVSRSRGSRLQSVSSKLQEEVAPNNQAKTSLSRGLIRKKKKIGKKKRQQKGEDVNRDPRLQRKFRKREKPEAVILREKKVLNKVFGRTSK